MNPPYSHQNGDPPRPDRERNISADRAKETQQILLLAMKAGQIQLENGAEIFRVEDTVMHICRAYGLHSVNIFVLSNGIFLSCGDEEEPQFAKVRQVPVNNTNLRPVSWQPSFGSDRAHHPRQRLDHLFVHSVLLPWTRTKF